MKNNFESDHKTEVKLQPMTNMEEVINNWTPKFGLKT